MVLHRVGGDTKPRRDLVGAEPGALYRVLWALASLGVFAETADGSFAMTPLAEALCSDASGSFA